MEDKELTEEQKAKIEKLQKQFKAGEISETQKDDLIYAVEESEY